MLKPLLLGSCLVLLAAGCATHSATRPDTQAKSAQVETPAGCVRETGSRLPPDKARCTAPGRTYSYDDLRNTGQTDVGQALQMLDPSISAHH